MMLVLLNTYTADWSGADDDAGSDISTGAGDGCYC